MHECEYFSYLYCWKNYCSPGASCSKLVSASYHWLRSNRNLYVSMVVNICQHLPFFERLGPVLEEILTNFISSVDKSAGIFDFHFYVVLGERLEWNIWMFQVFLLIESWSSLNAKAINLQVGLNCILQLLRKLTTLEITLWKKAWRRLTGMYFNG